MGVAASRRYDSPLGFARLAACGCVAWHGVVESERRIASWAKARLGGAIQKRRIPFPIAPGFLTALVISPVAVAVAVVAGRS
jgi:hypothetical protein